MKYDPRRYKTPICTKCGRVMKGFVPHHIVVTCYFCDNPPFDDNGEENTALKQTDVK